MTNLKKLASVLLVFALLLTMVGTAVAAAPTATVTITITSGVPGATYSMWQLMTATVDANDATKVAYTVNPAYRATLESALNITPAAGATDEARDSAILNAISGIDEATTRTLANSLFKALSTQTPYKTATSTTETAVKMTDVAYGYYLIGQTTASGEGGSMSMAMLKNVTTQNEADNTFATKEDAPTHVKEVLDTNDTQGTTPPWSKTADHDIGDMVSFRFYSRVSQYIDQYAAGVPYKFIFHDQMETDHFEFDPASVEVFASYGGDLANRVKIPAANYEVKTTGFDAKDAADTFQVVFSDLKAVTVPTGLKDASGNQLNSWAGVRITVEFKAKLLEGAVIGNPGNKNKSQLEYSNDISSEQTGRTPWSPVTVFTFQVNVNKVDKTGAALEGAGFTLYKQYADGGYKPVGAEVKTGTTFTFKGLDDGIYKLVETTVPAGYNKAADLIFRVVPDHVDASQTVTSLKIEDYDGNTISGDGLSFTIDADNGSASTNVVNLSGAELPETGGIGTTIFYVLGSLLVAAAVVLLVTKRRMAAKEN